MSTAHDRIDEFADRTVIKSPSGYPYVEESASMITIKIELSDDQAAVLSAKAGADGLSIEGWLRRRIDQEILHRRNRYTIAELVEQCDPQAPLSPEDREWLGSHAIGRELL